MWLREQTAIIFLNKVNVLVLLYRQDYVIDEARIDCLNIV
jgi:hypothetical protein